MVFSLLLTAYASPVTTEDQPNVSMLLGKYTNNVPFISLGTPEKNCLHKSCHNFTIGVQTNVLMLQNKYTNNLTSTLCQTI